MKKVLATILAFVYLSSTMGANIHLHYCMGKLASWSLLDNESKNCTECGMIKKMPNSERMEVKTDCCRDVYKQVNSNQDQKSSPGEFFKYSPFTHSVFTQEQAAFDLSVFSLVTSHPRTNGPPVFNKVSRFIYFGNFRI